MIIVWHSLRWAMLRSCHEKYVMRKGIPQGLNLAVGLLQLVLNAIEHDYFIQNAQKRRELVR